MLAQEVAHAYCNKTRVDTTLLALANRQCNWQLCSDGDHPSNKCDWHLLALATKGAMAVLVRQSL
jgi:hypothetical protein